MAIKVSVILPSLNVVHYIKECVESVMYQSLKEIEILCIDAGSNDGTLEILESLAKQDSRIRIIISPKKSYGYQLNIGFKEAKGEYIGIVETDDYIKPTMYETLYENAKAQDCEAIKAGFAIFTHEGGKRICREYEVAMRQDLYGKILNPSINAHLLDEIHMLNPLGIYKRDFITNNHIACNESLGASYQDNGLIFQINSFCQRLYLIKDIFYMLRRDNPNSSVHSKGKVYCACDEYDFIRDFLRKHPDCEKQMLNTCTKWRFNNYLFTLFRIDNSYKKEFLLRFAKDFAKLQNNGELEQARDLFSKRELALLRKIIKNPMSFYRIYILKQYIKKIPFVAKIYTSIKNRL